MATTKTKITSATTAKPTTKVTAKPTIKATAKAVASANVTFMKNFKDMIPDSSPSVKGRFESTLICGDCMHFKGSRHPSFSASCASLGISSKSVAPPCYAPDVTAFRSVGMGSFKVLATLLSGMTARQSRVLMATLKYAGSLERLGLTFLEEVYFKTGEYLDNYYKGYVVGVAKTHEVLVVGTDYLNASKNSTIAHLDKGSVIKAKEFAKIRQRLIDLGKIKSPIIVKQVKANEYEVPTIDREPVDPGNGKYKGRRGGAKAETKRNSSNSANDGEAFSLSHG